MAGHFRSRLVEAMVVVRQQAIRSIVATSDRQDRNQVVTARLRRMVQRPRCVTTYRRQALLVVGVVAGLAIVLVSARTISSLNPAGRMASTAASTNPAPAPIRVHSQVIPVPLDAPVPSLTGLATVLAPALGNAGLGALTGQVADASTGAILWQQGAEVPQTPGSIVKILTTCAALLSLPTDQRVTTKVVQGATLGQLVLIGGGDPTLTAEPVDMPGYYTDAAHLDDLVTQINSSGLPVSSIVVDNSAFAGPAMANGWDSADIGGGSITPIESVMLDGGRSHPLADYSPRTPTPALDTGRTLAHRLGLDPAAVTEYTAPPDVKRATPLASVQSAALSTRLHDLMVHSDDVLAETVGFEVAAARGFPLTFDGSVAAITQALQAGGFGVTGMHLSDASGLSTDDRIPARLIDDVLTAAAGTSTPALRALLDTLPVAGATGTLGERFKAPSPAAGWVRAKTGSLSGVSTLAGIVVDIDQRVLTFTLMSNGTSPEQARPAIDALAIALRGCGCR